MIFFTLEKEASFFYRQMKISECMNAWYAKGPALGNERGEEYWQ
jgi:hypothetical protein